MIEIRCPDTWKVHYDTRNHVVIFMAGGITGCPNWQDQVAKDARYQDAKVILINPRRDSFDASKAESSEEQIKWEYRHLLMADYTYVWFPKEGACAITLFELGWLLGKGRGLRIGVEPGYSRELDVREQVKLRAPNMVIYKSLDELYFPVVGM